MQTQQSTYMQLLSEEETYLSVIRKNINRLSWTRFVWFCLFALTIWLSRGLPAMILVTEVFVGVVGFLGLVVRYNSQLKKKEFTETQIKLLHREHNLIDYNFHGLDDGVEANSVDHPFSNDLDLFGNHSLFQYINRSIPGLGREMLIKWLKHPLTDKASIELRQEAIAELSEKSDFCRHFASIGTMGQHSVKDRDELTRFFHSENILLNKKGLIRTIQILPFVNLGLLVCAILGVIPFTLFTIIFLGNLGFVGVFTKRINEIHSVIGKKISQLGAYEVLFRLIVHEKFDASLLSGLQSRLNSPDKNMLRILRRINRLAGHLDQRSNLLAGTILNGILLWDLRTILGIERVKSDIALLLPEWLDAMSDFDALCSLGTFRYNHPGYVFPEIDDESDAVEIVQMGHPLMHRDKCVRNDLNIPGAPYFMIITGANMAGKSTYLRTLGINYLLGCLGAPVCAVKMKYRPLLLATSLKTSDSLAKNESYFFAELKRLQGIIHRLEQGERLFIILDEILKGTNSTDKQKGSLALVNRLIGLGGTGIIATHDLLLGNLKEIFPAEVGNFRFEADIHDDTLSFSYKIQHGIAQNMNACFLMEKMGIIGE